jgi:hypothetical protein
MTKLQAQLQRLYGVPSARLAATPESLALMDDHGHVRAMVLEVARPADWQAMSSVWQGVQADLDLPAPAIAVNGTDGYQLWLSLLEPLPACQAIAFLSALRERYLPHIALQRVRLHPEPSAGNAQPPLQHATVVPAEQAQCGQWSAFVAQDLAPMFAESPWLDIPPSPDGQAELLSRLASINAADFQSALARLAPPRLSPPSAQAGPEPDGSAPYTLSRSYTDPRQFLLDIMNNEAVALNLRIEAAKAILHAPR